MSRISSVFFNLKQNKKKAFIPFITAGDPSLSTTLQIMKRIAERGADIIELGVPFSDPMADGKVIQKSHERALKNNTSLKDVIKIVNDFRMSNSKTPIILMGYLNPIENLGYENFAFMASKAGVDGVLVVDMPPEESKEFKKILKNHQIDLIFLTAPTTKSIRLERLLKLVSGFVYFVSLKGVTGAKNLDLKVITNSLIKIKQILDIPIGVGFGVKDAKTAKEIAKTADAVIVGSKIVSIIERNLENEEKMIAEIGNIASEFSNAIKDI